MKKFLIILGVVIALGGAVFYYFTQYSNGGVNIEVNVPSDEVEVGRPFDVDVIFTNGTGNILGDVKIALDPSLHIVFEDDGSNNIEIRELGEISDGSTRKESFKVVALPGEETEYKVTATIFYSPASLVAEFKKNKEVEVRVKRPDFELELVVPDQVFSGEEFDIKVLYERDDEVPELAEFEVHIDHPSNLEIVRSTPEEIDRAIDGVRFKNLEEDDGEVVLRGKIELPDSSEFQIKARLVMKIFDEEHTFVSEMKNVLVEPSPLSFQVVLGERESIVRPGEELIYVLTYRNNTDVALKDVVIRAQLLGEMFDFSTLDTDGRLTSSNNTITWDSGNINGLRELGAGRDGNVSFAISARDKHPIQQLNDKNFSLVVDAKIESPTVPYLIDADKTLNTSRLENKVTGLIEVLADGYFRDAQSGILNSGPFPPKVGLPTNYTIHWEIANYGTDVDQVEVRARLGEGVVFTGETSGNTNSAPKIDPSTGEIVWQVGRLLATTGVLSEKPKTIFQVEARPSSSDVGDYMLLIGGTEVRGNDEFTETIIINTAPVINTRLPKDGTVGQNDGEVQ